MKINGGVYRYTKCHTIQWCDRVVTRGYRCNEFSKTVNTKDPALHTDEAIHILQNILACRVGVKSFSCHEKPKGGQT